MKTIIRKLKDLKIKLSNTPLHIPPLTRGDREGWAARYTLHPHTLIKCVVLVFLILLPQAANSAPQMADYCYLPPFVTDPNTPPNIMFVYEKGTAIAKRAYTTTYTYDPLNPYYGFFDSMDSNNNLVYYNFTVDGNKAFSPNYFQKSSTCSTDAAPARYKCISGNILNWALMTSLDLSRKVLVGFGWPKAVASQGAGDVYTYSGNFCSAWSGATCLTQLSDPISYGQYEDGNADTTVSVTVDMNGDGDILDATDYTYRFCLSKGSPEAFVTVNGQAGTTAPSCPNPNTANKCKMSGTCLGAGQVGMKFTDENRKGIIQEYSDKDSDYVYDSDAAARFGLRRWKTGTASDDRDRDILCDAAGGNCTSTTKTTLLRELLNAFSKEPAIDPDATPSAALGTMMKDIISYFKGNSSTYEDKDAAYTQSPYKWSTDPAYKCRKTYAVFITTGTDLTESGTALDRSEVSPACDDANLTYLDYFVKDTCYGFNKDLDTTLDGKQNIRTYVVHTTFYGTNMVCTNNTALTCTADTDCISPGKCLPKNQPNLEYASKTVGGGEYIQVNNPTKLRAKIEEAILNILSTSASASTVATLTTQTRESSTLTQAYFYPKREGTPLRWIGYLRLLWSDNGANLREDTSNKGWLDLKYDKILSFKYSSIPNPRYIGQLYNDSDGDMKIDSCNPADKENDLVSAIWNAQEILKSRTPDETDLNTRMIKIGIDNVTANGIVRGTENEFYDFETALNSTLNPFWSYASSCSNYSSRWCNQTSDCNYCTTLRGTYSVDRGCNDTVVGADPDCYYCDGRKTRKCSTTLTCIDTTTGLDLGGGCVTVGTACGGTGVCVGDCYEYKGTCTAGSLVCNDDYTTACAILGAVGAPCGAAATCVRNCSLDTTQYCSSDAACIGDYHGSAALSGCVTTDTCTTAGFTCNVECDSANCATSVIKYVRGYDKPSPAGSDFRERTQCTFDSDCPPSGTCSTTSNAGICSVSTSTTCSSDGDCLLTGEKCYGTCSSGSSNIIKTLKLGDIVYSTPRISPNSAVNGYDVIYKDNTYTDFISKKIKGNCTSDDDCPGSQTCGADDKCSGAGYTPIVIVGANDGMTHAFKVSKIKDITTPENDCYGQSCLNESGVGISDGSQVAVFTDNPNDATPILSSDIGKELWTYIPYNAVPYLKWYCSETYCHIPMVDARFTVVDASIDYDKNGIVEATEARTATDEKCNAASPCPDTTSHNYPWRRLLVGAMGVGGKKITVGSNTWSSSIFVLDITNPEDPMLLWERPLPDNTLTSSTPAIVRFSTYTGQQPDPQNGTWYLVMGSGPESVTTNKVNYKSTNANIYVFDLRTGDLVATLPISGATGVAVADMMAVDMDSDYQVDDIYFGTYGGSGATQTGKLYRLRIRLDPDVNTKTYQTTPSNWDIETMVDVGRPIYASPEIAQDAYKNIWIYFGTGLYLSLEHASATTDDEYLYGVKETAECWKGISGSCSTYSNFLDTSGITFTGAKASEIGCFCAGNLLSTYKCNPPGTGCPTPCTSPEETVVTKVTDATIDGTGIPTTPTNCTGKKDDDAIACIVEDINSSSGCSGSTKCNGWRRAIDGEKIFSRPFVAGGLVDFTSFKPKSDVCSLGGETFLISLHYTTGTAYVQPTIFLAGGTSGSMNSLEIKASVSLGIGVPPLGESLVALPLSGDTYKVITQVSGGLPGTQMNPSSSVRQGYVLWLVK